MTHGETGFVMLEKVVILITRNAEENIILQNTVSRLGYTAFSLQNIHEIQSSYTALKPISKM